MMADAAIDDLCEELAEDAWSEEEVSSLYQLEQRCHASSASEVGRRLQVNGRIDACVAATEICGLVYGDPEQDFEPALQALRQELRDLRYERRRAHLGDSSQPLTPELVDRLNECDREAEQILLERINAAIRRWNDRVLEDPQPSTETTMATATTRRTKTAPDAEVCARFNPDGELQWFCPACGAEHPEQRRICACEAVRPSLPKLRDAARLAEQRLEAGAVGPEYRSREPDLSEDDDQRRHQLEALLASCSADTIPKIRKPVKIAGREFVMVGGVATGREGYAEIHVYEAILRGLYVGPVRTWRQVVDQHNEEMARDLAGEATDAEQVDATLSYDRLLVTCGSETYVLVGPEHELDGEGIGPIAPKPAGKSRRRNPLRTETPSGRVPETQAEAAAKEAGLTAEGAEERIELAFTPATLCSASITLRKSTVDPDVWFDRIDQSTHWQDGDPRASTEMLSEHFPGLQTSRQAALACALHRLRERWEGVEDQFLTPEGRKARKLALRQLAAERRRLLGDWAGPAWLQASAAPPSPPATTSSASSSVSPPPPDPMPRTVPVSLIRWRQDNPRGAATAEEVARKAATLSREGQLAPIGLRALPDGTLEGWWGERRFRAAEQLGWETILAVVFPPETPDLLLVGKRAAENLDQEDLDPVARARHLRERLIALGWDPESDDGPSLRSLAKEVGISQGDLSNQLGLLKLPTAWQQRLIAREITPTQARSLLPWIGRPQVLKAIERELRRQKGQEHTTSEFADLVRRVVREVARCCAPGAWIGGAQRVCELTARQIEQHAAALDLVELDRPGLGRERYAFNVQLFDELNQQARQAKIDREEQRAAKGKGKGVEPTEAEQKAREEQQAKQLEERVARYKRAWLQQRMAARIVDAHGECVCGAGMLLKLVLYFAATERRERDEELACAIGGIGGRRVIRRGLVDVWATLSSLPERPESGAIVAAAAQAVTGWLTVNAEGYRSGLRREDIPAIAAELGVDLAQEWRVEEAFLELFTKDQLRQLGDEWKIGMYLVNCDDKRPQLIAEIMRVDQASKSKRLPPPKILVQAK